MDLGLPLYDKIEAYKRTGGHFFERSTLRFFRSRILRGQYPGADGYYFVTSEQFVGSDGYRARRKYTVRRMSLDCRSVDTVGEFQGYGDSRSARREAKRASYASQGLTL